MMGKVIENKEFDTKHTTYILWITEKTEHVSSIPPSTADRIAFQPEVLQ